MESKRLLIALNMIPMLGPRRIQRLLNEFDNMDNFYKASFKDLSSIPDFGDKVCNTILEYREKVDPDREIAVAQKLGMKIITLFDENYPRLLKEIYDPPPVLYSLGKTEVLEHNSISIVGTRKASTYGRKISFEFAKDLASMGINVVSGMARGIDTYAHRGALDVDGPTTAVLGCGLDVVYPPENLRLMKAIARCGCVISSFPLGTKPLPSNFPARNRIISGLCLGTLVVEAATKSGSLITADFSLEQGREVFAIPGNILSPYSRGTNQLIKQGAKLVEGVDDILDELYIPRGEEKTEVKKSHLELDKEEESILKLIDYHPIHMEELLKHSNKSSRELNIIITRLELKNLITSISGGYVVRV